MKYIASEHNPSFRAARALHGRKERDRSGLYLIEGPHVIEEALKAGIRPETVWWARREGGADPQREVARLLGMLEKEASDVIETEPGLFRKLCDTVHPQGILAIVRRPEVTGERFFGATAGERRHFLVLDRIQDPGNLGTILRTADAAGFRGAIALSGTADEFAQKTVRAAVGALFRVPVLRVETPAEAIDLFRERALPLVAADARAESPYCALSLDGEIGLIIGNEATGVDSAFDDAARPVSIPMAAGAESLNAAVAAGILMFWARQAIRRAAPLDA